MLHLMQENENKMWQPWDLNTFGTEGRCPIPYTTVSIDVPGFFFRGGGKIDPLECRNFFSGGKVGGPGGK